MVIDGIGSPFAREKVGVSDRAMAGDAQLAKRYERIGELTVERDFFAAGLVHEPGRAAIADRPCSRRSVDRGSKCRFLKVARQTLYGRLPR